MWASAPSTVCVMGVFGGVWIASVFEGGLCCLLCVLCYVLCVGSPGHARGRLCLYFLDLFELWDAVKGYYRGVRNVMRVLSFSRHSGRGGVC